MALVGASNIHESISKKKERQTLYLIKPSKGAFRLCYKNCRNLGCMQEIASKNRSTFYTRHPTLSNFKKVSVIDFEQRFVDCVPICDCVINQTLFIN